MTRFLQLDTAQAFILTLPPPQSPGPILWDLLLILFYLVTLNPASYPAFTRRSVSLLMGWTTTWSVMLCPRTKPSLLVVFKVQVIGWCSKWNESISFHNKSLRASFLFNGPITATCKDPSSRLTLICTFFLGRIPSYPRRTQDTTANVTIPFQKCKLLMVFQRWITLLKLNLGLYILTSKRIPKTKINHQINKD